MSRYSRWGYFTNRRRRGLSVPTSAPVVNVSESSNQTAVVYTITTNVTTEPNVYYTMTGNIATSDFTDSATDGNITLDAFGNATLIKTITSNVNVGENKDFAIQITTNAESNNIIYAGNTHTFISQVPFTATGGNVATYTENNVSYKVHCLNANTYTSLSLIPFSFPDTSYAPKPHIGNLVVTNTGANANAIIEVLLVGGGGRSGENHPYIVGSGGGGGGAVDLKTYTASSFANTTYTATIGVGGWKYVNDGVANTLILDTITSGNVLVPPGSSYEELATPTYFRLDSAAAGSPGGDAFPPWTGNAGSPLPYYTAGSGGNGGAGYYTYGTGGGGGGGSAESGPYIGNNGAAGSGGTGATAGVYNQAGNGGTNDQTLKNWWAQAYGSANVYLFGAYQETIPGNAFSTANVIFGNGGAGSAPQNQSHESGVKGGLGNAHVFGDGSEYVNTYKKPVDADAHWVTGGYALETGDGGNGFDRTSLDSGLQGTVQVRYETFDPYRFLA